MKTKSIIFLLGLFLLNSCIVKSINPFFTRDKVEYDRTLEGHWKSKNGEWKIISLKDEIRNSYLKDKKHSITKELDKGDVKFSKEDLDLMKKLKDTYVVYYTYYGDEAMFIATPFKVGDQLFLDFTPFDFDSDGINSMALQHLIKTHSVCMVEYDDSENLKFKWLSEDVVKDLMKNNKLKIKHQKIGLDDDFVLSASSNELYRFIEKFMASDIPNKWEKDQIYTLTKVDDRP